MHCVEPQVTYTIATSCIGSTAGPARNQMFCSLADDTATQPIGFRLLVISTPLNHLHRRPNHGHRNLPPLLHYLIRDPRPDMQKELSNGEMDGNLCVD